MSWFLTENMLDEALAAADAGPGPRYALVVRAPELDAGEWVLSSFGENWPLTWGEVSDAWHEAIASPGACWRVYAVVASC